MFDRVDDGYAARPPGGLNPSFVRDFAAPGFSPGCQDRNVLKRSLQPGVRALRKSRGYLARIVMNAQGEGSPSPEAGEGGR